MYESRNNLPFLTKLNAKPKVSLNPLQSKGAALDPPETLSLDSARALPLTRWDSVPDPAKGRSPFEPEFRCRSQARSLCTDGTVCFRWVEKSKTMPFLFQSQPSKDGEEGAKIGNEEEKKGEGKEIQRGKP